MEMIGWKPELSVWTRNQLALRYSVIVVLLDWESIKLIKSIKFDILDSLTLIINQSLMSGVFPDKLKLAKVIPLYKKGDSTITDNYRPISLLPTLSKVLEKIVYNQLFAYFSDMELFYPSQYGFRRGQSTELAATELIDLII